MEAPSSNHSAVAPDELERERVQTYVDWAQVRAPWWLGPALALAIAGWFVGYGLGPLWGAAGGLTVAVVAGVAVRVMADRGQVSMPRFRGMPRSMKLAYLPALVAYLFFLSLAAYVLAVDAAPHLLLGLVAGGAVVVGTAWSSRRFRMAADRLADAEDLRR